MRTFVAVAMFVDNMLLFARIQIGISNQQPTDRIFQNNWSVAYTMIKPVRSKRVWLSDGSLRMQMLYDVFNSCINQGKYQ